jgi:hypothetical protein
VHVVDSAKTLGDNVRDSHPCKKRKGGAASVYEDWKRWASCDLSRRCTRRNSSADGRSVTEATMRTVEVVMLQPGREMLIAFLGVEVMANVGPLAQCGLDKAFRLAVGAGRVRAGEAVLDAELEAGGAEVSGAIAGARTPAK